MNLLILWINNITASHLPTTHCGCYLRMGKGKSKQTNKQLHPHSRKLKQLTKKLNHKAKQRNKQTKSPSSIAMLTKLKWFQKGLDASKEVYEASEVRALIEKYLSRFDTQFKPELTPHCSWSSFTADGMLLEKERDLFSGAGLEAPDLTSKSVVKFLREWDGEFKWIQSHIPLKRFCNQ